MNQLAPTRFRYPLPTREDLPALSRLAFDVSVRECQGCRNYHVAWPYLRSIGANGGGPEFNWPDQLAVLGDVVMGRRHVRWLLAGSADAGKLGMVAEAMKLHPQTTWDATLVDRCGTPLAVCRAHAETAGIALSTTHGQLNDYVAAAPFDIVLMHHTIVFVPGERRAAFLTQAAGWLAPHGQIVMTTSFDRPDEPATERPNRGKAAWREQCVREAVEDGSLELPEPIDVFIERVRDMRDPSRAPYETHRASDYYAAISQAGLVVDRRVPLVPNAGEEVASERRPRDRVMLVLSRAPEQR